MLGGSLLLCLEIIKSQFQDFLSLMISQQYNFLSSMIILNGCTGWIVSAHVLLGMISWDTKMAQWFPFSWQLFICFSGCDTFLMHMVVYVMDCRRPLTISCTFPTLARVTIPHFPWLVQIHFCCLTIIMNNASFPLKIIPVWVVNYLVILFPGSSEQMSSNGHPQWGSRKMGFRTRKLLLRALDCPWVMGQII